MRSTTVTIMALSLGEVSAAVNDFGARQAYAFGLFGRGDKETVTVTVTPDCTPAETPVPGVSESSTPVVIVPGTQSETGSYTIPAGGATITPGVSSVAMPSSVKESTAVTPVPETPASGSPSTTPSPVVPASVNTSSIATPVGSGPVILSTTAVSTKVSTSSKTTSVESTSTEETASATPTPASASTSTPATGAAVNNFAGVYTTLIVVLVGTVALLI